MHQSDAVNKCSWTTAVSKRPFGCRLNCWRRIIFCAIRANLIEAVHGWLRFGYHGLAFQNINTENGAGTIGNVSPPDDAITSVRPCALSASMGLHARLGVALKVVLNSEPG